MDWLETVHINPLMLSDELALQCAREEMDHTAAKRSGRPMKFEKEEIVDQPAIELGEYSLPNMKILRRWYNYNDR